MLGDLNTPLSLVVRASVWNISQHTEALNNPTNPLTSVTFIELDAPNRTEHTLFSKCT